MTEEAIEYLKDFITNDKKIVENLCEIECEYYDEELDYIEQRICRFETILNLIEKQQKEIEELNIIKTAIETLEANNLEDEKYIVISKNSFLDGDYNHLLDNYISKQKIKEKIEELNNNKEDYHFYICSDDIKRTIKTNLEQLLEEE